MSSQPAFRLFLIISLIVLYGVYFATYFGMARLTAPPPLLPPTVIALAPTDIPTPAFTPTNIVVASVTPGPPPDTPTNTPTPRPTLTNTPVPPTPTSPRPSNTPVPPPTRPPVPILPTDTPRPAAPTNPNFRVDATTVNAGSCTTLRWDVDGIRSVYLNGDGQSGHGNMQVCPTQTSTYTLRVVERSGNEADWPLQVKVNAPAPVVSARFRVDYKGCIPAGNSPVKGQVFDTSGHIIVRRAIVQALVNGQPKVLPVAPSNEDGWYEWFTSPNQDITINTVTLDGRKAEIIGGPYTVRSTQGCFQHINLVQVP